jgi:hypothetical protein
LVRELIPDFPLRILSHAVDTVDPTGDTKRLKIVDLKLLKKTLSVSVLPLVQVLVA